MKHNSMDIQCDSIDRIVLGLDRQIQARSGDLSIPLEQIDLQFDFQGLVPAVTQDAASGQVLMVAWMNQQALQCTLETGQAHFWSRSRQELWHKGATSGNVLRVREIWVDCDADTLLLKVTPAGPACHTGEPSCFYRRLA